MASGRRKFFEQLAGDSGNYYDVNGLSFRYNQLVQNGNFENGFDNWLSVAFTHEIQNNVLTVVGTNTSSQIIVQRNMQLYANHKYLINLDIYNNEGEVVRIYSNGNNIYWRDIPLNEWHNCSTIYTFTSDSHFIYIYPNQGKERVGITSKLKNIFIVDLTDIFGAGNEPSSVDAFFATTQGQLYQEYVNYNPGGIWSVSKVKIGDNTKTIDLRSAGTAHDVWNTPGKITRNTFQYTFSGNESWSYNTTAKRFSTEIPNAAKKRGYISNKSYLICDKINYSLDVYMHDDGVGILDDVGYCVNYGYIFVRNINFNDLASFKNYMTGKTINFELETPSVEYTQIFHSPRIQTTPVARDGTVDLTITKR